MILRHATADEAVQIAEVHIASWQAAYRGLLPDTTLATLSVQAFADRWKQRLEAAEQTTIVSEMGGRLAGFSRIGPNRDAGDDATRMGELYAIYLDPAYWGRGIGKALWERSRQALQAHHFSEVTVWVLQENTRARRFYERVGFQLEPTLTKMIHLYDVPLPEVRYRLVLENSK